MRRTVPFRAILALSLALGCAAPAMAQLSINYNIPGVSIGVNLGGYPSLQRIPGYPVYYAPGVNTNYFFYDGLYWVFDGQRWYASSWYNGPWGAVDPYYVPDYVLRVPVRYYRHAPAYFRGWRADAAPRWDEHWGRSWHERRRDWDRWDRRASPAPAPLPAYQRNYRGERYPREAQQRELHSRNYRYEHREEAWRGQGSASDRHDQAVVRQQKREERQMDRNDAERNSRLGAGG